MVISILLVLGGFCLFYFGIRGVCSDIIERLMNKNAYKKRKKGITFKEWFTLSRFRLEVPRYHIIMSYIAVIVYAIVLLGIVVGQILGLFTDVIRVSIGIFIVSLVASLIYEAIFVGIHYTWTWIYRRKTIKIRGVDKKAYMEKRRKQRKNSKLDTRPKKDL